MMPSRSSRVAFVALLAALPLGGCIGDANPLRDVAIATGLTGGEPKPAPDFVVRTRPDRMDYTPVGVSAPKRDRIKSPAAVTNAEAEMEALRARNAARGAAAQASGAAAQ